MTKTRRVRRNYTDEFKQQMVQLYNNGKPHNGYDVPALYDSYAKAYRKIMDYDNEILILDEGIMRKTRYDVGTLKVRRDKAMKLIFVKQEAERIAKVKI